MRRLGSLHSDLPGVGAQFGAQQLVAVVALQDLVGDPHVDGPARGRDAEADLLPVHADHPDRRGRRVTQVPSARSSLGRRVLAGSRSVVTGAGSGRRDLAAGVALARARAGVHDALLPRALAGTPAELVDQDAARVTEAQAARLVQALWDSTDDEVLGVGPRPVPRGTFAMMTGQYGLRGL